MNLDRIAKSAMGAITAAMIVACVATPVAEAPLPEEPGESQTGDEPYAVEGYPHVWYGGRFVYLIGDRWYYAAPGGWEIVPGNPPELVHERERILAAPAASTGGAP